MFKQLLLTIAENTYSENIMRNLHFNLMAKLMTKAINGLVRYAQSVSAEFSKSRVRATRHVDAYKSITYTIEKETDLFFSNTKNQDWNK